MFHERLAILIVGVAALSIHSEADDATWSQFRGPNSSGVLDQASPPTHFGPGTNMTFAVPAPPGASSPALWGDRLFLTAFENGRLLTLCSEAKSGETLWQRIAPGEKLEIFQPSEGSPASATPATDGKHLISYFGSRGVICYDFEGKQLWQHAMEPLVHVGGFGSGTSPMIAGGLVLINRDAAAGSKLVALRVDTGEIAWESPRPELPSSYATPVLWHHGSEKEVVIAGSLQLRGYDLATGKERWRVVGTPPVACTTPVIGNNGVLYYAGWSNGKGEATLEPFDKVLKDFDQDYNGSLSPAEFKNHRFGGFFSTFDMDADGKISRTDWEGVHAFLSAGENVLIAVRPGRGDLTKSHVLWKQTRGLPYVPSPLFYRGNIYVVKDGGLVSCFDAATGDPHYLQERLGPTGSYYSSPIAARDHIYIASVDGKITVLTTGKSPQVVNRADLNERLVASPALAGKSIFYRSEKHLWRFDNN
jgi:outer membrane protein assembly factor BamB